MGRAWPPTSSSGGRSAGPRPGAFPTRTRPTATLLNNGQALVAGVISFHAHRATELASAELYTP